MALWAGVRRFPGDTQVRTELAYAYMANRWLVHPRREIDAALAAGADDADTHYVAGVVYAWAGDTEQAEAHLRRALQLNPAHAASGQSKQGDDMSDKLSVPGSPIVLRLESGGRHQALLEGSPATRGMRCGHVTLEPGQECGEHSTKGHEETLVFLTGSGTVRLGGHGDLSVAAAMVAYVPPHTAHNVVNTGQSVLRYVYVVAPVAG